MAFKEFCFDSMVVWRDVYCEKKANNKSLKNKCEIIGPVEKGMANKKASEKSGVPKNTISTWVKNNEKLLSALQEASSSSKKNS